MLSHSEINFFLIFQTNCYCVKCHSVFKSAAYHYLGPLHKKISFGHNFCRLLISSAYVLWQTVFQTIGMDPDPTALLGLLFPILMSHIVCFHEKI